jgi:hypothetical protein
MPYLHFNHAYNFHAGSYDGGVLEYSTNGGSTWTDAIGLLESGRDYNGTVRNTFSNPLGGKSAYVDDSHGYVSTRLDLTMLAGQSVDFRWRVGTDSVADLYAYGWWLDDVRVYHCNSAPVAIAQGLATDEDTGLAITLAGSDVDGDSISYSISAAPANGTLSGAAPNLTYTPNPNYFGSDSFSYTVDDGAGGTDTAVISITVNSVNDAPGAATLVTPADSATDVDPASVAFKWQPATDVDGDTVSYELKVCEDAGFNTGCNSVNIASLQVNILIAGIGGGSLLLLGVAGMSMRRKQLVWAIPLYITIALLAACSSGSSSDPVFIDTSINATVDGLTPGIDYYWKVITSDGNTGVTDSSVRMFTTAP